MAVRQFQEVEGGYQQLFGFLHLEVVHITEYHGSRLEQVIFCINYVKCLFYICVNLTQYVTQYLI